MSENLEDQPLDPSNIHGEQNVIVLTGWLKRKLGHPYVRIELTPEHYIDNLNESLRKYVSYTERTIKYFQFVTTAGTSVYNLPTDFIGLQGDIIYLPDPVLQFLQTYASYQMYVNFTGNLQVSEYHAIMEHLQLKVNQIGAVPTWEIIPNPPRIKIYPTPQITGRHVLFAYAFMPRLEEWTPQQDLQGYGWVCRYALMLCKENLGRIRGRFGDSVVVGDMPVSQDSAVLLAEADKERIKLDEELEEQRSPMPVQIF